MAWVISGSSATSAGLAEATAPFERWRVSKITISLTADHTPTAGLQVREGTNVLLDTAVMAGTGVLDDGTVVFLAFGGKGRDIKNLNYAQVGTNPGANVVVEFL